jgi:hypothetical protein
MSSTVERIFGIVEPGPRPGEPGPEAGPPSSHAPRPSLVPQRAGPWIGWLPGVMTA